jgi:cytochrome P450
VLSTLFRLAGGLPGFSDRGCICQGVGGPLARLEVNLAFENFIRRVENPRLVEDPPPYRRSPMFRGPRHLWVEFDRIAD